ncbi:hypothetical protein HNR61_000592 [Actinomadura namibiensis]|uniref:Uncharacterized protein n=1 Tax=Actinomadura namibiensis TaxID=182080 RepID=A0A7W3LIV7_ACTNM|nr:hypothetical protein [Actinomadura namibiensis]
MQDALDEAFGHAGLRDRLTPLAPGASVAPPR